MKCKGAGKATTVVLFIGLLLLITSVSIYVDSRAPSTRRFNGLPGPEQHAPIHKADRDRQVLIEEVEKIAKGMNVPEPAVGFEPYDSRKGREAK